MRTHKFAIPLCLALSALCACSLHADEEAEVGEGYAVASKHYPAEVENLLLFNEVMYDHASGGAEYIELYNPSDEMVSIPSLRLLRYIDKDSTTTIITINRVLRPSDGRPHLEFPPRGYICLTKSPAALVRKHAADPATLIEIENFPSINNDGGYLAIMTDEIKPRIIDRCSYFDDMHTYKIKGTKRKQGIALEKKAPDLPASKKASWQSSEDATGGTPGKNNFLH